MFDFPSRPTWAHITVHVDNVNEALPLGLGLLQASGVQVSSRGMSTIEHPGPVSTIYQSPMRRVLFDSVRDANPFFHMIDALWLLSGSRHGALPKLFLPDITRFSDNGVTFHGAYGHRIRRHFGHDQLLKTMALLRDKPDTRQAVISIWDPKYDLGTATKDMPCNDMIMFCIRDGRLHMTVCNRSNDVIWGAYGANVVQFSMLQEVMAVLCGVEVGVYVQQSNSYHVYEDNPFWASFLLGNHDAGHVHNHYMNPDVQPWAVALTAKDAAEVLVDCETLAQEAEAHASNTRAAGLEALLDADYHSRFFQEVVWPMIHCFHAHTADGNTSRAIAEAQDIEAVDWRVACSEWLLRRKERADKLNVQAGMVKGL